MAVEVLGAAPVQLACASSARRSVSSYGCSSDAPRDAPRLAQALLNLLCYGVRRAAQGGKHLELRARGTDSEVYIEVDDDGPRPTPKAAAQAFDVFSGSSDANSAVSGLGLSMVDGDAPARALRRGRGQDVRGDAADAARARCTWRSWRPTSRTWTSR